MTTNWRKEQIRLLIKKIRERHEKLFGGENKMSEKENFVENFDFISEAPPQIDKTAEIKAAAAIAIERKIKANLKSGKEIPESWKNLAEPQNSEPQNVDSKNEMARKTMQKLAEIMQAKMAKKTEEEKQQKQQYLEFQRELQNLELQISEFEEHLKMAKDKKVIILEKMKNFGPDFTS